MRCMMNVDNVLCAAWRRDDAMRDVRGGGCRIVVWPARNTGTTRNPNPAEAVGRAMNDNTRKCVPLILGLLIGSLTACSSPDLDHIRPYDEPDLATGIGDLTDYLAAYAEAYDLPAMAAAVVDTAGVRAIGVSGDRRRDATNAAHLDDAWHLGSAAKSMFALLVATMVEDELLGWDSTVRGVLGDRFPEMNPGWQSVTISHLLTHRGGAPPNLVDDHPALWQALMAREGSPTEQRRVLVEAVTRTAPAGTPGVDHAYSNAGYAIAGAMAEEAAGLPWEELMRQRVFSPLGLASAGFGAPGGIEEADQPWGHAANGTARPPGPGADNPPGIGPAGTIHMSIGDWATYAVEILGLAAGRDGLVRADTFGPMLGVPDNQRYGYAMGWELTDEAGPANRVATHSGSNTLWYSLIWMPLEPGFGVLAVTNQGGDRAREAIDQALWNLVLDTMARM